MSNSFYGSADWRKTATSVTSGACCSECGSTRDLIAHHDLPRVYGGSDTRANLRPVCRRCHPTVEARAKTLLDMLASYNDARANPTQPVYAGLLANAATPNPPGRYAGLLPPRNALMAAYASNRTR